MKHCGLGFRVQVKPRPLRFLGAGSGFGAEWLVVGLRGSRSGSTRPRSAMTLPRVKKRQPFFSASTKVREGLSKSAWELGLQERDLACWALERRVDAFLSSVFGSSLEGSGFHLCGFWISASGQSLV